MTNLAIGVRNQKHFSMPRVKNFIKLKNRQDKRESRCGLPNSYNGVSLDILYCYFSLVPICQKAIQSMDPVGLGFSAVAAAPEARTSTEITVEDKG